MDRGGERGGDLFWGVGERRGYGRGRARRYGSADPVMGLGLGWGEREGIAIACHPRTRIVSSVHPLTPLLSSPSLPPSLPPNPTQTKPNQNTQVQEGDVVTMCSSTFGDEMWSCRGAGLSRVLSAIRLRAGPTVKLVFENSSQSSAKKNSAQKSIQAAELARKRAQDKKDSLLKELESDNQKLKKGKFLGLF